LATAFAAWSFAVIFPAATEILVPMAEHFRLGWIVVQITALIFLLAVVEQTQHTFHLFNKYGVPSPILDEAPGLIELLKARGRRGQEITLIDEGEGKVTEYQALYASIADTGAPFFQVSSRDESDPHPLTDSQWIWPIRYGEKTATKLQQLAGDHCPGEVRNYFLIRQGSGRFECVRKAGN
ncbi:MAG: hypothetical protein ACXVCH_17635, partial [Bdellovibrionota bacterium]